MNTRNDKPVLQLSEITKSFPGVLALDGVSLEVRRGEVMALVGENGAGKSTLMKVINGIHTPDYGTIHLDGRQISPRTPLEAKAQGITMIHQELSLVSDLSVAENIFLGELPRNRFGLVKRAELRQRSQKLLDRLGCHFAPEVLIKDLTVAHRQLVEIARALVSDPKLVIFDEPTTSLTDSERVVLFEIIRELRSHGVGMIYISHKFDEIFELSDRISILRDGTYQGVLETAQVDEDQVVERMIGRKVDHQRRHDFQQGDEVRLSVEGLTAEDNSFRDVNFELRAGEVLGFYGLIGSGRTEILETLFGLRQRSAGEVRVDGEVLPHLTPGEAVGHGLGLIPEDRKEHGLALSLACDRNIAMALIDKGDSWLANNTEERRIYAHYHSQLEIKSPGPATPVKNLSGGNQQKVVIGKWLATEPRILLVDEPTRGIDVGSKTQIHKLIRQLASEGYAILVVSSEMPEILAVSDRILALYNGAIAAEFRGEEITEEGLGAAISGLDMSKKNPSSGRSDTAPVQPHA